MKKHKRQISEQKKAVNSLSLISEGETGYLQDWAKINQIRQQQFQSSNQLPNSKNQRRQQSNIRIQNKQQIRRKTIFNTVQPKQNNIGNQKKYIQVRVQNFVTISDIKRRNLIKNQRSQQTKFHKSSQDLINRVESGKNQTVLEYNNQQEKRQQKASRYENSNRLKPSCSMNYIEKIRKLSLPWIKQMPKYISKKQNDQEQLKRDKQEARRLSQIIKNKIRRKRSNKFIIQKQGNQNQNTIQNKKQSQIEQKAGQANKNEGSQEQSSSHEIRLLKSWLQLNRSKNKKSVMSLLRQHFQNKYFQKKKLREKMMRQETAKVASLISQYNRKFQ